MNLEDIKTITDMSEVLTALLERTVGLESELTDCKCEVSRLNRIISRLRSKYLLLSPMIRNFALS